MTSIKKIVNIIIEFFFNDDCKTKLSDNKNVKAISVKSCNKEGLLFFCAPLQSYLIFV